MGLFKEILSGVLLISVILIAISSFQSNLFATYGADNVTGHTGQQLSYMNRTAEVASLTQQITNQTTQAGNTTDFINDFSAPLRIALDTGKLILKAPELAVGLFTDAATELEFIGIPIGQYMAIILIVISISAALALVSAILKWDL